MNSPSSVQEFPQLSCNHEVGAIKKQRIRTLHFLRRAADTEVDAVVNYEFHYMYYIGKCDAMIRSAKNGLQNLSTGNATLFDAAMNQKERNAFQNDITTSVNESLGEHQESMMGRINSQRVANSHKTKKVFKKSLEQIEAEINAVEIKLWQIHNVAATRIQRARRAYCARISYIRCKKNVVRIQSAYRRHQIRKNYDTQKQKLILCQKLVRKKLAIKHRVKLMARHEVRFEAATIIQACYKGYIQRMKYHGIVSGMELYQRAALGVSLQQFCCEYSKRLTPAEQHSADCCAAKETSQCQHSSQQSSYPRKGAYLALRLQTHFRGYMTRRALRNRATREQKASTLIQSSWRSYCCRNSYMMKVNNIFFLQCIIRKWLNRVQIESQDEPITMQLNVQVKESLVCGLNNEFIEDLTFCCRNVSVEEEMNEFQQSFEEEMGELQIELLHRLQSLFIGQNRID
jgi:hypothetical protein